MTDPGWQITPHAVDPDIAAAVEHVDALLPVRDDRTVSWGRIADRLDNATIEELKLIGQHTI